MIVVLFLFELSGHHRDLLVLSHSCPTRRASDLGDNISSLYQVYSLRSVEIVSLAQKSRTDDLQRLISSEAQFDIGSGDVGRPLEDGVAGAVQLAKDLAAKTYEFARDRKSTRLNPSH